MGWLAIIAALLPLIEAILKLLSGGAVRPGQRSLAMAVYKRLKTATAAFEANGFDSSTEEFADSE